MRKKNARPGWKENVVMATSASIIICMFNRSSSLAETLESITQIDVPEGVDGEVLAVDNNSTDISPLLQQRRTS